MNEISFQIEILAKIMEATLKNNASESIKINVSCQNTMIKYEKINGKETFKYNFETEKAEKNDANKNKKRKRNDAFDVPTRSVSPSLSPLKKKQRLSIENLEAKGFNDADFHIMNEANIKGFFVDEHCHLKENTLLTSIHEHEEMIDILSKKLIG